ncbi:heme ABC transporter ATP-binding protein [Actinomycetaceae bacterium TAE3-ERU4]|nr:heme ABC transporter ATP-binding protein [Actinomycetaceae bacterium TAE3-ERU4]
MIQVENLHFSYGAKKILNGLNLEVKAGQVLGLLGPNGAGKSTLLTILCADLEPSEGNIKIAGKPLGEYQRKELARVRAVMPQRSDFPFAYFARDIVSMGRFCYARSERSQDDEKIVETALAACQVDHLAEREITQLSGGEQARVTLARVLAQQTPIVFLDEPTAALDIAHQQRTMQICRSLAAAGACVVAVMHDLQLAAAYCDKLALMQNGKIISHGTGAQVLESERLTKVYGWPIETITLEGGRIVVLPDSREKTL